MFLPAVWNYWLSLIHAASGSRLMSPNRESSHWTAESATSLNSFNYKLPPRRIEREDQSRTGPNMSSPQTVQFPAVQDYFIIFITNLNQTVVGSMSVWERENCAFLHRATVTNDWKELECQNAVTLIFHVWKEFSQLVGQFFLILCIGSGNSILCLR